MTWHNGRCSLTDHLFVLFSKTGFSILYFCFQYMKAFHAWTQFLLWALRKGRSRLGMNRQERKGRRQSEKVERQIWASLPPCCGQNTSNRFLSFHLSFLWVFCVVERRNSNRNPTIGSTRLRVLSICVGHQGVGNQLAKQVSFLANLTCGIREITTKQCVHRYISLSVEFPHEIKGRFYVLKATERATGHFTRVLWSVYCPALVRRR